MKDYNIDGKLTRVFVLKEVGNRVVYIALKHLHRVDYDRLTELSKRDGELLKVMSSDTLDNGMNALTQYEHIIQVMDVVDGKATRLRKPYESQVSNTSGKTDPNSLMLDILSRLADLAVGSSPAVDAPAVDSPAVDAPAVDSPAVDSPAVASPKKAPARKSTKK